MITHNYKSYFILMGLLVTLAGTRYEALNINPFQPPSPTMLMFLISLFCHAVASTADMSFPTTIYIFHISGVVGCETLLLIIVSQISYWCIINSFVLVVTLVCHTNCDVKLVYQLSRRTLDLFRPTEHSNDATIAPLPPTLEPQQAAQSSANCKPYSSHEDEYISSHEIHRGVSSCLSQNNSTAKKLNGKSISRRSCYCSTERPCKSGYQHHG